MARPATEFGHAIDQEIEARTARGESAETIASALGLTKQVRTIRRRQDKLKGKAPGATVSPSRPSAEAAGSSDVAEVPDEIPEGTPVEQLDRFLKRLEIALRKAEEQGNLAAIASIAAKVAMLMNLKHRITPLPKPDPNENPDLKALAEQGEKRLLLLVDELFADSQASQ